MVFDRALVLPVLALLSCREPAPSAAMRGTGAPMRSPREPARTAGEGAASVAAPLVAAGPSAYVEESVGPAPGPRGPVVVVAIHGLGDSPEHFLGWLRGMPVSARVISMRGSERYGPGFAWWRPSADERQTAEAIDRAAVTVRERAAPALAAPRCGRPIVLGFSQGAMVSFALAARGTLDAALVIPIGGRLPLENRGVTRSAGQRPLVRAMHGAVDARMPLSAAQSTVSALERQGMDATVRGFPGVGHEITDALRRAVFDEIARAARAMGCAP